MILATYWFHVQLFLTMMNKKDILNILQQEKRYLQEMLSIGLFGSYSKGDQGPQSDIDLLVELSEPRVDFLAGIQIYLEDRIGKRVEVIRKRKDSCFSSL
jgi:uncharacterized protein